MTRNEAADLLTATAAAYAQTFCEDDRKAYFRALRDAFKAGLTPDDVAAITDEAFANTKPVSIR